MCVYMCVCVCVCVCVRTRSYAHTSACTHTRTPAYTPYRITERSEQKSIIVYFSRHIHTHMHIQVTVYYTQAHLKIHSVWSWVQSICLENSSHHIHPEMMSNSSPYYALHRFAMHHSFPLIFTNKDNILLHIHVLYWTNLVQSKDKEKRKLHSFPPILMNKETSCSTDMYYTEQIWFNQRTKKQTSWNAQHYSKCC